MLTLKLTSDGLPAKIVALQGPPYSALRPPVSP